MNWRRKLLLKSINLVADLGDYKVERRTKKLAETLVFLGQLRRDLLLLRLMAAALEAEPERPAFQVLTEIIEKNAA